MENNQGWQGIERAIDAVARALLLSSVSLANNKYKFNVYRSAAYTTVNGALTAFPYDAKNFDTNANVDVVTTKGRFTAPVAGFYQFNACLTLTGGGVTTFILQFYKNGAMINHGVDIRATTIGETINAFIQLAAGDYIDVYYYINAAVAVDIGIPTATNSFSGFLVTQQ